MYCPDHSDKTGDGYNLFNNDYKKCDGSYLPHLEKYGKAMKWYQIVDTQGDKDVNKVVSEGFKDDEDEMLNLWDD